MQQKHDIWKIGLLEKTKFHTRDCNKKHKITHTRLQKNTKLHTRKQKITYQAIEKTIELCTQKHKIANQIAAKNNKKITYQIATKITI
jgi:hypothetical protein